MLSIIFNTLMLLFTCSELLFSFQDQQIERSIVVVIPSYNNAQWYRKNLQSIFTQRYSNYRIIYIDDCSTDGTGSLVEQYIKECKQGHRVLLLHNKVQAGALANHYKAVHMCDDYDIIVNLDGDDWLKHDQVFARINEIYSDPHVWLTYGSYQNYPSGRLGECSRPIPAIIRNNNAYREHSYSTSHLRTFYAELFKKIKLGDLLYNGKFFQAACDTAFMFPMLEMARDHVKYLKEVFYVYNQSNPHNHFRKGVLRQLNMVHIMRSRNKYDQLKELPAKKVNDNVLQKADIIIMSENNPEKLQQLLESVFSFVANRGNVHIVYQANEDKNMQYKQLQNLFSQVRWYKVTKEKNFKSTLLEGITSCMHNYLAIMHDNVVVKDNIDLNYCVQLMKQTHAYGFFFFLGKDAIYNRYLMRKQKQPPAVSLNQEVYAWKFCDGEFDWSMVNNINMTLYKKKIITSCLKDIVFNSIESLAMAWAQCWVGKEEVGLFFKERKSMLIGEKNNANQTTQTTLSPIVTESTPDEVPILDMIQMIY